MKNITSSRLFTLFVFSLLSFLIFTTFFIGCAFLQKPLEGAWVANLNKEDVELLLIDESSQKYYIFNNLNNNTNAAIGVYTINDNLISFDEPDDGFLNFKGDANIEYTWERSSDSEGEILSLHFYDDTTKYRLTSKDIQGIVEEGLNNIASPMINPLPPMTTPPPPNSVPPTIVSFFPVDGATDVPTDIDEIKIVFDKDIAVGTGFIYIDTGDGNTATDLPIDVADPLFVGIAGSILTISGLSDSTLGLMAGTAATITVDNGAVVDTETTPSSYSGMDNWSFTPNGIAMAVTIDPATSTPAHSTAPATTPTTITVVLTQPSTIDVSITDNIEIEDTTSSPSVINSFPSTAIEIYPTDPMTATIDISVDINGNPPSYNSTAPHNISIPAGLIKHLYFPTDTTFQYDGMALWSFTAP